LWRFVPLSAAAARVSGGIPEKSWYGDRMLVTLGISMMAIPPSVAPDPACAVRASPVKAIVRHPDPIAVVASYRVDPILGPRYAVFIEAVFDPPAVEMDSVEHEILPDLT
jgi:hypothetical protein